MPGASLRVDAHTDVMRQGGRREARPVAAGLARMDGRGLIDLRVHDYFTDDELWDYLSSLDVSVLPYRFGTHSGWLEACYDLGTTVAGAGLWLLRRAAAVRDVCRAGNPEAGPRGAHADGGAAPGLPGAPGLAGRSRGPPRGTTGSGGGPRGDLCRGPGRECRMHVVMIAAARFPLREPFAGGLESLTWHLCSGLRDRGVRVSVFAGPGSDPRLGVRRAVHPPPRPECGRAPGRRDATRGVAERAPRLPAGHAGAAAARGRRRHPQQQPPPPAGGDGCRLPSPDGDHARTRRRRPGSSRPSRSPTTPGRATWR